MLTSTILALSLSMTAPVSDEERAARKARASHHGAILAGALMGAMAGAAGGFGVAFGTAALCFPNRYQGGEAAGGWFMMMPVFIFVGGLSGASLGGFVEQGGASEPSAASAE